MEDGHPKVNETYLFISENCPHCHAVLEQLSIEWPNVPITKHGTVIVCKANHLDGPESEEEAKALAFADEHDVFSVPTLVEHGVCATNLFDIVAKLKEPVDG